MGGGGLTGAAIIRPARASDGAEIGRVHAQAWRETYAGLLAPERIAAVSARERGAMWSAAIARGQTRGVCIAEQTGAAIGFGACGHQRSETLADQGFVGEITALYVLRSGQRRGIGSALVAALARRLIAEGYRAAALWVLSGNEGARRFYESIGGTVVASGAGDHAGETGYGWRDLAMLVALGRD